MTIIFRSVIKHGYRTKYYLVVICWSILLCFSCAKASEEASKPGRDKKSPVLGSIFPAPNSDNIDLPSKILITFSEPIRMENIENLVRIYIAPFDSPPLSG